MTNEQIAEIAEGLTKAQKRLLKNHPFWGASTYQTIKSVRSRGLMDGANLTPTGLAVRDYLERNGK